MEQATIQIDLDSDLQAYMQALAEAQKDVHAAEVRIAAIQGAIDYITQLRAKAAARET